MYNYSTKERLRLLPRTVVTCDECGKITNKRKDPVRGEFICEECGAILGRVLMLGNREVVF